VHIKRKRRELALPLQRHDHLYEVASLPRLIDTASPLGRDDIRDCPWYNRPKQLANALS
jgi:hypothetical protein